MDLKEPLQDLLNKTTGSAGAILIDNEGEAITYIAKLGVEQLTEISEDERVRLIGAYQRILLRESKRTVEEMRIGNLKNIVVHYETGIVAVRALKEEYALVLIGCQDMLIGQGLFYLNKYAEIIDSDL